MNFLAYNIGIIESGSTIKLASLIMQQSNLMHPKNVLVVLYIDVTNTSVSFMNWSNSFIDWYLLHGLE